MWKAARKILGILRGGGHPVEIGVAAALGVLAGLVIGRNGLVMVLLLLMLVLNVNKPAFALTLGPSAAVAWLIAPLKFGAGRWLLSIDPAAGLFGELANAPVGALMGLDTYSVVGGLVLALPAAAAAGVALWWITRGFRRKMLAIAKGEGKLGEWSRSTLVRFVKRYLWGPEEPDYEKELKARPKIVRVKGVVVLVVLSALAAIGSLLDHGPLVRGLLAEGLTSAAGAQVDVADLAFRPLAASLRVEGLEVTDAEQPERNVFEAKVLAADVGVGGLLRRSLVIDEARISELAIDTPREEPGRLVEESKESARTPEDAPPALDDAVEVDRYVDWGKWRGLFEQLRRIVKRLRAYRDAAGPPEERAAPETDTEDELLRRAETDGYASIRAPEIVRTVPDLLVRRLIVEGIPTGESPVGPVDVCVENLAYPAALAPGPMVFRVSDRAGKGAIELVSDPGERESPVSVRGSFSGLSARPVGDALSSAVPLVFEGGTMDVELEGTAGRGWIDIAVEVRCVDLVARPRAGKRFLGLKADELRDALEEMGGLTFKLIIRGDPRKPRVRFVGDGIGRKLKDAAIRGAKRRAKEE
ncbi:MAG: hypothetical protein ACYSU0_22640, partial [Planctomycetota bacterium]